MISLQYFQSICSIFDIGFTHSVDGVLYNTFFRSPYCKRTVKTTEGKRNYLKGRNFRGTNFRGINLGNFGHNSRK